MRSTLALLLGLLMAISFIGSAVGSSSPNTATTITLPTLLADDVIIIAAAVGDTANNGIPAPTGYTRVPGVAATLYANDVNDTNLDLYYKIAVAGDSGATVTLTATGGTNASNAGVAMVFRGVDTTTPFDVNAATATAINTSAADPPSLDHGNPSGVWTVIAASTGHTGGATATFTFPTGYTTNAAQRAHNDTIDVLVGVGYNSSPADPENPAAFSAANIGTAADNAWAAGTMALRPAVVTLQVIDAVESGVVAASEVADRLLASIAPSESAPVRAAGVAALLASIYPAESAAVRAGENEGAALLTDASESLAVAESGTASITFDITGAESMAAVLAEVADRVLALVDPQDSAPVGLSEALGALAVTLTGAESARLAAGEDFLFSVTIGDGESLPVRVSIIEAMLIAINAADSLGAIGSSVGAAEDVATQAGVRHYCRLSWPVQHESAGGPP